MIADESGREKERSGNSRDIRLWSGIILSIMQMYHYPVCMKSVSDIAELLFTSTGVADFSRTIAEKQGLKDIPTALKQSLNRLWNVSLNEFQHFWNEFSRQMSCLTADREMEVSPQIVIYLPETDSSLVKAALFAQLQLICRIHNTDFDILDIDVSIGEEAKYLFSNYADRVTFAIYANFLDQIKPCLNPLTANLENMACFGVNGNDADTLLKLYSSQVQRWQPNINTHGLGAARGFVPNYSAADFMPNKIPDGGALIYTRKNRKLKLINVFL